MIEDEPTLVINTRVEDLLPVRHLSLGTVTAM